MDKEVGMKISGWIMINASNGELKFWADDFFDTKTAPYRNIKSAYHSKKWNCFYHNAFNGKFK